MNEWLKEWVNWMNKRMNEPMNWNEWADMNELEWVNWNEWTEIKETNEWIQINEEMNKLFDESRNDCMNELMNE